MYPDLLPLKDVADYYGVAVPTKRKVTINVR